MSEQVKSCSVCKTNKSQDRFWLSRAARDGYQNTCIECSKKRNFIRRSISRAHYNKNTAIVCAKVAAWRVANPDKINARDAKRRFLFKKAIPKWLTESDWIEIKWAYKIAQEWSKERVEKYHVDHIIPLQGKEVCGLHIPSNLQIIKAVDNFKKSNHFSGRI